uniref:Uncharacterized protein n=1 Tax=Arundo donax TaxID=35708 RepID=A0A0A9BQE1_ARUDO
MSFPIGNTISN